MMIMMEKRPKSITGYMQHIVVYSQQDGAIVGKGWVIHANGLTYKPTLIDLKGNTLEEGWYNIRVEDDGHLIVLNKSIH